MRIANGPIILAEVHSLTSEYGVVIRHWKRTADACTKLGFSDSKPSSIVAT